MKGLLVWGAGSQSRLLLEYLKPLAAEHLFVFDHTRSKAGFDCPGTFVCEPAKLHELIAASSHYLVAIGGPHGFARDGIHGYLQAQGLSACNVVHPTAHVEPTSIIGEHCHLMMGAKVHHFAQIGDCTILNTASVVEHECVIGRGVHIMGGAHLGGRASVGDFASIGTNATILPDVRIGTGAYVGAGAVVTRDVPDLAVVAGNPAKFLRNNQLVADKLVEKLQRAAK